MRDTRRRAEREVNSEGLRMIVFPVASAGATFHANMSTVERVSHDELGVVEREGKSCGKCVK